MKILLLSLFLPLLALADSFEGKVVNVSDGDTVKVLRQDKTLEKIRLLGIDAPEKNQDFGQKSKTALNDKVAGQMVKVEYAKRDRYGRLLAKIWKGTEDVNLSQIQNGLAWHYKQYAKEQGAADAEAYAAAEVAARGKTAGLWAGNAPTPPWEFRQARKIASKEKKAKKKHKKRTATW